LVPLLSPNPKQIGAFLYLGSTNLAWLFICQIWINLAAQFLVSVTMIQNSVAWDRIREKDVQSAIARLAPTYIRREVKCGECLCDFQTPTHLIEVKRTQSSQPVHQVMGQILYYRDVWELQHGDRLIPTILIYGSDLSRYLCPIFTAVRHRHKISLWLLQSLRSGTILDLDKQTTHEVTQW
jgi:hypothetical protein